MRMARKELRAAGSTLVLVAGAALGAGCPWSAATPSETSTDSEKRSVEAEPDSLPGTYRVTARREATGGCEPGEPAEREGSGVVRISSLESDADRVSERVRVQICSSGGSCDQPVWEGNLQQLVDEEGWGSREGKASALDGSEPGRRCRLEVTMMRAAPTRRGIRLERTVRRREVALEGDLRCLKAQAAEYADQLDCVSRTVWTAAAGSRE